MRRLSSMGERRWKKVSDRPAYNGEDVIYFDSTSWYNPGDIFNDEFNPWFGEPDDNGIYFEDINYFKGREY